MIELLVPLAVAALVACALGPLVVVAGVHDMPDEARKAHVSATPTSGGLAVAAGFGAALLTAALLEAAPWAQAAGEAGVARLTAITLAAMLMLGLGAVDDVRPLDAKLKFALGALAALVFSVFVAHAQTFPIGPRTALDVGLIAGVLGSALWVFTLTNAVNFMDGANGLALGSTAIGLLGLAAVSFSAGAPHVGFVALVGAAALLGLLVWNFPAGRLFAGDAGALFAGMLASTAALVAVVDAGISPVVPPLLFFPMLADVLLTLLWRVRRGKSPFTAHRDHVFQIALRAGLSHGRVSLIYWAAAAHCAAIGWLASLGSGAAQRLEALPQVATPDWLSPALPAAVWLSALAPWLALAVFALLSIRVFGRVRRYAEARGLLDQ